MPVTPQDRPIEALREGTVDQLNQLIMNYGHGKLSREAFERRLDEALEAKSHERLLERTSDLDLKTDRQYTARKKTELGIRVEPSAAHRADEVDTVVNVFAGNERRGVWDVPRALRLSGVHNRGGTTSDPNAPLLVVEGVFLFGGVDIRVTKTPRQRLTEFADQLRAMFEPLPLHA